MVASIEPNNQVLGTKNLIMFKFTPSRDLGLLGNGTFWIYAPPMFVIEKRCPQFSSMTLPGGVEWYIGKCLLVHFTANWLSRV